MEKNKTVKYLKYAVGEILLVIVGILIAVSINGWNENRKLKIQEQLLLKDLRTEVAANLIALDEVILEHEISYEAALELRSLFRDREAFNAIADSNYRSLLFKMDVNYTYDPRNGILNSMIASGQINNLSNKELKYLLASLKDNIADAFESTITIEQERTEPITRMWAGNMIKNDGKIIGNDIRRSYENTEYRFITALLFIITRKEGLREEYELKETMKYILELIDQEINNESTTNNQ